MTCHPLDWQAQNLLMWAQKQISAFHTKRLFFPPVLLFCTEGVGILSGHHYALFVVFKVLKTQMLEAYVDAAHCIFRLDLSTASLSALVLLYLEMPIEYFR